MNRPDIDIDLACLRLYGPCSARYLFSREGFIVDRLVYGFLLPGQKNRRKYRDD